MWKPAPSCHSAAASARNARNPTSRGAARFHYVQAWKAWERLRHDHPGRLLAAGLLALAAAAAGVALWVWRARRGAQG